MYFYSNSCSFQVKFHISTLYNMLKMGLGQKSPEHKPPGQKPPNNKRYKLMFFLVSYVFFLFLFLCLTVRICKIFFVFYNMIRDFFFTSSHIYIFVSLHTFWTYCTASIIFHIKLFLELEDIINNWSICLRITITLIKKITHWLLLITSKVKKVIIYCLSIKTISD